MSEPTQPNVTFASDDGRFALHVPGEIVDALFERCRLAGRKETGGILVGRYDTGQTRAVVTKLPPAPRDSAVRRTSFERGTKGLRRLLERLWRARQYYIGEWHFHPDASSQASRRDHAQMATIARSEDARCPEPVLLIVGGRENDRELSVYVYPDGTPSVLHPEEPPVASPTANRS